MADSIASSPIDALPECLQSLAKRISFAQKRQKEMKKHTIAIPKSKAASAAVLASAAASSAASNPSVVASTSSVGDAESHPGELPSFFSFFNSPF